MTIIHKFDDAGGFVVGDTTSGITSYAYPSSTYAKRGRVSAGRVAFEMIGTEPEFPRYQERDAANWKRLGRNPDAPGAFAPVDGVYRASGQEI